MLKVIEIKNIKGISDRKFELDILPNKPSLLVAPNGFGKSSFAVAFNSMNSNRIVLKEDDLHQENSQLDPEILIQYQKPDNSIVQLKATKSSNTISNEFAYFVINNPTRPKGIGSPFGRASASLEIEDVVLVDRIPNNVFFNYQYKTMQARFGKNAKVLPNANTTIQNLKFIEKISLQFQVLKKANGSRIQKSIQNVIDDINIQSGTAETIIQWIVDNKLEILKNINYLNCIGKIVNSFDLGFNSEAKSYLIALQLIWLYNLNTNKFKDACNYSMYLLEKEQFEVTLATFNSTWKNIRAHQTGGKLVVKFPKAIHISNGQRDILSFVSMLFKAKRQLRKNANILIIDEVFDYLDDGNLTAAQYYITNFIKDILDKDQQVYPLILTHLNPSYFKNFAFSSQKVYYLDKSYVQINNHLAKILRVRGDKNVNDAIRNDISKHLLHFHPVHISRREDFKNLSIRELWGESDNFYNFIFSEVDNYLNGRPFCPFSVCGGVRVKIEEIAYKKLREQANKDVFLSTNKTRRKLEEADRMGVVSPESHYLLGIIYNEGMHWNNNQDNISPIASKLENLTIKNLINDVFK
jgi:ABC-type cobalamin/Fe3+-siderophores transport system ATPase subunit